MKIYLIILLTAVVSVGHSFENVNTNTIVTLQNDIHQEFGESKNRVGILKFEIANDKKLDLTFNIESLPYVKHINLCPERKNYSNLKKVLKDVNGNLKNREYEDSATGCDSIIRVEKAIKNQVFLTIELNSFVGYKTEKFNDHINHLPITKKFYTRTLLRDREEVVLSQFSHKNKVIEVVKTEYVSSTTN